MRWKEFWAAVLWMLGICLSIIAIFGITSDVKLSLAVLSVSVGILAIIWVFRARRSLSSGSSLRSYTTYFLVSLIFVLLFSLWTIADEIAHFEDALSYIGFIFITIAYFIFLRAAYQILTIGKEFGFQQEAVRIKTVLQEAPTEISTATKSKGKKKQGKQLKKKQKA